MRKAFLSIVFLLSIITACKKEEAPAPSSIPLVKTEELKEYIQGVISTHFKNTYTYDAQYRVATRSNQNMLRSNEAPTVYSYDYATPNQVKESINGTLQGIYTLNANGYATQWKTATGVVLNDYTPDANGYFQLQTNTTNRTQYVFTDGNMSEYLLYYVPTNSLNYHEKLAYETNLNTIGNENKGMKFMGKSSKNLVKSRMVVHGNPMHVYSYTYTYDADGRAITQNWSRIGGNQAATSATTYSYY